MSPMRRTLALLLLFAPCVVVGAENPWGAEFRSYYQSYSDVRQMMDKDQLAVIDAIALDMTRALKERDYGRAETLAQKLEDVRTWIGMFQQCVRSQMVASFFKDQGFEQVLWLSEHPTMGIAEERRMAIQPLDFSYYYLALLRTRGFEAVQAAHEGALSDSDLGPRTYWVNAWERAGWIDAQVMAGKTTRDAEVERLLGEIAEEDNLSPEWSESYRALDALCMRDGNLDTLRSSLLDAMFEGRGKVDILCEAMLALSGYDGKGTDHLVGLTREYLKNPKDDAARLRAQFFLAALYRLQATEIYKEIAWNKKADELPSAPVDLRFIAAGAPRRAGGVPREIIFNDGEPTARTLSQQANWYLVRVAPGSAMRSFPLAPITEERKKMLFERALEQKGKKDNDKKTQR